MKHIGFWILLFVAVLIPATASIAASAMYPEMAQVLHDQVRKQQRHDAVGVKRVQERKSSGHRIVKDDARQGVAAFQGDALGGDCCEANACNACVSCSACFSVAFVAEQSNVQMAPEWAPILAPTAPRAEFLLSGQERPPRLA
jgi:hypothetical protein